MGNLGHTSNGVCPLFFVKGRRDHMVDFVRGVVNKQLLEVYELGKKHQREQDELRREEVPDDGKLAEWYDGLCSDLAEVMGMGGTLTVTVNQLKSRAEELVKWRIAYNDLRSDLVEALDMNDTPMVGDADITSRVKWLMKSLEEKSKVEGDWRESYNQLCSDLAYELGMDDASTAGDYQVKKAVAELVKRKEMQREDALIGAAAGDWLARWITVHMDALEKKMDTGGEPTSEGTDLDMRLGLNRRLDYCQRFFENIKRTMEEYEQKREHS